MEKANLNITALIGTIAGLFVIALIVISSVLIVSQLSANSYAEDTAVAINETLSAVGNATAVEIADVDDYRNCALTITKVTNTTEAGAEIDSGEYTLADCGLTAVGGSPFTDEDWVVIGTAYYDADTTATEIADATNTSFGDIPDWIPLLIILVMVVIVMGLVVAVILTIKKTGLVGGGNEI